MPAVECPILWWLQVDAFLSHGGQAIHWSLHFWWLQVDAPMTHWGGVVPLQVLWWMPAEVHRLILRGSLHWWLQADAPLPHRGKESRGGCLLKSLCALKSPFLGDCKFSWRCFMIHWVGDVPWYPLAVTACWSQFYVKVFTHWWLHVDAPLPLWGEDVHWSPLVNACWSPSVHFLAIAGWCPSATLRRGCT